MPYLEHNSMNYARVLMKTSECSVSKDRVVKLKREFWILLCPHLVKQFMKSVVRKCYPYVEAQYDRAEDTSVL
jgi:hypothetical protein